MSKCRVTYIGELRVSFKFTLGKAAGHRLRESLRREKRAKEKAPVLNLIPEINAK